MDVTPNFSVTAALSALSGRQACLRHSVRRHGASKRAAHASPSAPGRGGAFAALRKAAAALLFAGCLLPAPLAAQDKADPVIYPRGTAPAGQGTAAAPAAAGGLNSLFLLGTAVAAAAAGWWLWSKRRPGLVNGQAAKLSIVESRSLGSRQYLVVADYDGRKFLLSVCPGSIDLPTPLDGNQPPQK